MFSSIIKRLWRLVRGESGPTAVEYAVMLALIIMAVFSTVQLVGTNSSSTFRSAEQALDPKTDGNMDGNGQY